MKHNVFYDGTGMKLYRTNLGWATDKEVAKEFGYSDPEIPLPGNLPKPKECVMLEKSKQLALF